MKMKKEHYEILRQLCFKIINDKHYWKQIKAKYAADGLSERRFRWDLFWTATSMYRNETGENLSDLIAKDLLDDHIDTALRSIVKELDENEA